MRGSEPGIEPECRYVTTSWTFGAFGIGSTPTPQFSSSQVAPNQISEAERRFKALAAGD